MSFDDGDDRVLSPSVALAEIARIRHRYRLDRFRRRAIPDDTTPVTLTSTAAGADRGWSVNAVQLVGRLCADAQIRATSEAMVAAFTVAVRRSTGEADFVPVVCVLAEVEGAGGDLVEGCPVVVFGWLRSRQWDSGGQFRSTVEVVARRIFVVDDGNCSSDFADVLAVRYRVRPRFPCDRSAAEGGPASPRRSHRRSS